MPTKSKKKTLPATADASIPPLAVPPPPHVSASQRLPDPPPAAAPMPAAPVPSAVAQQVGGVAVALIPAPAKAAPDRKVSNYQATLAAMRKELWADVPDEKLWLVGARDKKRKGFCQVPRTLPLLMNIINDASKQVAKLRAVPAGRSYLALWCRDFGQAVVRVENESVIASEAGYTGERSVSTWREHLRVLKDLGFIKTEEGPAGPAQWVLLMNPYDVVRDLKEKGWVQKGAFAALMQRALEVGGGADVSQ